MNRLIWALSLLSVPAGAHDAGEMSIKVGPEQGVTERSETAGFKLHPAAIARLKLGFAPAAAGGAQSVPADAIVHTLGETGIYRRRGGFIARVPVEGLQRKDERAVFRADLKPGDEILVAGVGFVRIIEAAFGKPETEAEHEGHAHDGHEEPEGHDHD